MLTLILGGPGCGKTNALLNIIDDLLSKGVPPSKIAYLAFTKKAANEGLTRAMKKFNLEEKELPFFRTIHSLAFQQLALDPNMVMADSNWREFGATVGMRLSNKAEDTIGKPGLEYLSMVMLSRLMKRSLRSVCQDHSVNYNESLYVEQSLNAFKQARNLVDFTDMLEQFQVEGVVPPVDYLIVDEGQDLSRLQWSVVERIAERVEQMWVAGDDDQAIYEWAGADVEHFLGLEGKKVVLPVSYRLKSVIFDVTQNVVTRIRHRYDKDWTPHAEGGEIDRVNSLGFVNIDEGSWYILARNHYLLEPLREHLRNKGYPYIEHNISSTDNENVRSMIYWEYLRKGERITGQQAKLVYLRMKKETVVKKKIELDDDETVSLEELRRSHGLLINQAWFDVMRVSPGEIEYYRACRQRGEKLLTRPRITLSTIHGVKGGEADNVFLVTDMAHRCYQNLVRKKSDEETRVFYVATSRAKNKLFVCNPMSSKYYDLLTA